MRQRSEIPGFERYNLRRSSSLFCVVALHYPKPEHRQEMIEWLRRASEFCLRTDGCLSADCWIEEASDGVVTIGTWKSKAQFQKSFAAMSAAKIDWQYDTRESRPRTVYRLVLPERGANSLRVGMMGAETP